MSFQIGTPEDVRNYLKLTEQGIDADNPRYGDDRLGSNTRASAQFLQRVTRRQLEAQTAATKKFTSDGRTVVPILDLRTATSVTLQGVELIADETYWLLPDPVAPEVFTRIQVRPWTGGNYRSNPEWFDRNLDRDQRRGWITTSLPNDLVIVGDWGHSPYPPDMLMASIVLAAWYTKRPDAVLANRAVTEAGTELRYDELPPEVGDFLRTWKLRDEAVVVGG